MKKSLLSLFLISMYVFALGQVPVVNGEISPNPGVKQQSTKGAWNVQFNYTTVPADASAGCETDGTNFYITKWNGDKIWKMNNTGAIVDSFSIPGVTGLRDLAYDGQYFYGGASANVIYKMDFTNKTLVGTIASPSVTVRNICYDPHADNGNGGFWVANWDTDITLVSRSGVVLSTISSSTHGQTSVYGSAYDTISPGGPYIWVINANQSVNTTITQLDVNTGMPTGLSHDLTTDVCNPGEIGGGLFIQENLISGTATLGGLIQNVSLFGYELATTQPTDYDLAMESLNLPAMVPMGQGVDIAGTVTNQGSIAITSFDLNYRVNGGSVVSENITGVNIGSYGTYNFTHSTPWVPASGSHTVEVWTSNPNSTADPYSGNDTMSMDVISYDPASAVQRFPLHEGFTSSTCGPCAAGNANLSSVFNSNPNKWVCIKYQMSWPGSGDPYYTDEANDRRVYYGITSVPNLKVDGGEAFDGNSNSYSTTELIAAYNTPAFVDISADLVIDESSQNVALDVTVTNNIALSGSARLFVGIVEQETSQNVGTNGETSFDWVMKKMLPDANGKVIGPLDENNTTIETYNYTFQGNYRLPADAGNPINHSTEHSVEEFDDLIAVVWVQDQSTGEVYQSAYSTVTVGMDENDLESMNLNIYPNPSSDVLNIAFTAENASETKVSLISNTGQVVYASNGSISAGQNNISVDVENIPAGIYFMKIETDRGSYTKPVIIK